MRVKLFSLGLLVLCSGCYASRMSGVRSPQVLKAVQIDSVQFEAVVDTVVPVYGKGSFGIKPVMFIGDSVEMVRQEPGISIIAARRAALSARGIKILREASVGRCPGVLSTDPTKGLCPDSDEEQVMIGRAREIHDSLTGGTKILIAVYVASLTRSGSAEISDEYVLEQSNGRWKVVRIENKWVSP